MHHGFHIWSLAINFQVQQNFAGSALLPRQLIALKVNGAEVIWLEKTFAMQGRSAENLVLRQTTTQVSFIRSTKLSVIHAATDFTHLFP